jgi:PKD repeat protein
MKKLLLSFSVLFSVITFFNAQQLLPVINKFHVDASVEVKNLSAPDVKSLLQEDKIRDNQGLLYRIGVAIPVDIRTNNSGTWTLLPNGDRQWQLRVKSEGAEALSFLFETFKLYGGSTLTIRDLSGKLVHKPMSASDVEDHGRQNAALCFGDDLVITLHEPNGVMASEIWMDRVMYNYRSTGNPNAEKINESETCEVNVNCTPVGDAWQDEKRGVARIYVVESGSAGWCTGSLVNNTAQDCKPYFLTALHCGVSTSAANMTQWKFYFRYESPNCTNPSTAGTLDDYFITGCVRKADSGDGGGDSGSDFLLVQLGSAANEAATITSLKSANFNAYWNGWNANTTATAGGVGIHHPAGDIKKISTFTGNTVSSGWNGNGLQSHWRLSWTSNSNGWGVTEGGSSGSPLFNNSQGYIVGTLTGGSSYCTAQSSPDYYGKMSYHWTSNGTTTNRQLKPWLDPTNSGVLILAGSSNPCTPTTPVAPVANFVANQTNVTPATTVSFTDQSTGIPTSWAWSISPATGWAYAGGTTASSQNPQVTFNTVGQYSVTLTATNAQGSDAEVKTNYIIVAQATGPCTPSISNECDEYIQNVTLNTINNTTACSTGGYASYTTTTTSLIKGTAYTVTVTPAVGANIGQAYTNDEIAVWIDYNNDFTFSTAERVGYVLVAAGWSNQFNFTVPTTAATGAVRMRARISYQPDGAIDPCGVATYGETEDYTINITSGGGVGVEENSLSFVNIYPNPTESEVIVDLTAVSENVSKITLLDITGKEVKSIGVTENSNTKFDVSNLASGLYQVVISGSESTLTRRIIKK